MKNFFLWAMIAVAFTGAIVGAVLLTRAIFDSSLPLWLKVFLVG